MKRFIYHILLTCAVGMGFALPAQAQEQEQEPEQKQEERVYTEEHPLIYEDAWDMWPYVFLNESGEPEGFNIDLLKLIFKELNIPYIIKLKPMLEAEQDLLEKKSDLMFRMDANFTQAGDALYGKSVVQMFTHSIVMPKKQKSPIYTGADLSPYTVIVRDGSFSHHMIQEKHWAKKIEPLDDMKEAILKVSNEEGCVILWNTMSLKWMMRKYPTTSLTLANIDFPNGEYKFMSHDARLLAQMDSVYTQLRADDRLRPIRNKWFYPEHKETGIPSWIWELALVLAFISLCTLIYYIIYKVRERRMTQKVRKSNERFNLVLKTSGLAFWIYIVADQRFTQVSQGGKPLQSITSLEFSQLYRPEDFKRLMQAMDAIIKQKHEAVTLELKAKEKAGDTQERDYTVTLSILRRNKMGKPIAVLYTKNDVTEERLRQRKNKEMMLRYRSIFNTAMIDMMHTDKDGYTTDMNKRSCQTFKMTLEEALKYRINVHHVLGEPDLDLGKIDYYYATQSLDREALSHGQDKSGRKMYYELQLVPIYDSSHQLECIYGSGREVTEIAETYTKMRETTRLMQKANDQVGNYIKNIDYALTSGNMRIVTYDIEKHILNIFKSIDTIQFSLTQTRALNLIDEEFKRETQRILTNMDNRTATNIHADIRTTIRQKDGTPLYVQLHFIPLTSSDGETTRYFGICRDISELKAVEARLEQETIRAKEMEIAKNDFLRNMSYEIRTPLNSVVGFAELFEEGHLPEDEAIFIEEIKANSSKLLKLVNDILFLSRLDAGRIEINPANTDFAAAFTTQCQMVWMHHRKEGVDYVVQSPYAKMMTTDLDCTHVMMILENVLTNAVQHTTEGKVVTSYEYADGRLTITVEDTGCGIPDDQIDHIFKRFVTGANKGTGLGLSICNELTHYIGGEIHLKSIVGKGTTVWFSFPCTATEIETM